MPTLPSVNGGLDFSDDLNAANCSMVCRDELYRDPVNPWMHQEPQKLLVILGLVGSFNPQSDWLLGSAAVASGGKQQYPKFSWLDT
jgi:hypothetical protein